MRRNKKNAKNNNKYCKGGAQSMTNYDFLNLVINITSHGKYLTSAARKGLIRSMMNSPDLTTQLRLGFTGNDIYELTDADVEEIIDNFTNYKNIKKQIRSRR